MPIYEYNCLKCGSSFEKLVKSSERDEIRCPLCDSAEVERKLSAFATPASPASGGCSHGGG